MTRSTVCVLRPNILNTLFCSAYPASRWMHWATRWCHSVLSAASSLASSQVMSTFFRLHFTMSVQFILGRPGFLLYHFNSHSVAWWGILESSIRRTCPTMLNTRCKLICMARKQGKNKQDRYLLQIPTVHHFHIGWGQVLLSEKS